MYHFASLPEHVREISVTSQEEGLKEVCFHLDNEAMVIVRQLFASSQMAQPVISTKNLLLGMGEEDQKLIEELLISYVAALYSALLGENAIVRYTLV